MTETKKLPPFLEKARMERSCLESGEGAEIQMGVDESARGEARTFHSDEELRAYFEDVKARGRQRLAARDGG